MTLILTPGIPLRYYSRIDHNRNKKLQNNNNIKKKKEQWDNGGWNQNDLTFQHNSNQQEANWTLTHQLLDDRQPNPPSQT